MFLHYLKIAWRNLLRYKAQSVISVLGLAIGFTAFAFTMSWIRYERTYDSHIADADRIYRVFFKDSTKIGGISQYAPNALAAYLKENYPEIEAATGIYTSKKDWNVNDKAFIRQCHFLRADTAFFHLFYPEIKVVYPGVMDKDYYLLTTKTAKKLGLGSQHIGQRIDSLNINLLDIIPDRTIHSNVPFDVVHLQKANPKYDMAWGYVTHFTYIKIKEGVNIASLEEKLSEISIREDYAENMFHERKYQCKLVPLKKLRTTYPDTEVSIQYRHLQLFATVALLVIFCAFFNYLMLFINKIKIRKRGLALHKANGASNFQLLAMLLFEFIGLLVVALMVGLVLAELLHPSFVKFSMIEASKSFFLRDLFLFGLSILLLSLLFAFIPIRYFMKRSIQENLLPETGRSGGVKDHFTIMSIGLQLVISILLIFSTTVFMVQFNYLNNDDIGFDRRNVNAVYTYPNEIPIDEIRKIPGVEEAIRYGGDFLPKSYVRRSSVDLPGKKYTIYRYEIFGPEYVDFFGIRIVEGRNIFEGEKNVYLINQTADRLLATRDSTGIKKINDVPVVGVIEDMYTESPLVPVFPSVYGIYGSKDKNSFYAYRYLKESRYHTEKEIERLATEEIGNRSVHISNMEELYAEYTQSERYLLILLSIMTGIAVLIALFGIYAMITLACNKRRKEIAIRKVNGAKAKDIFSMFFRQYFWITALSCFIAFPVGILVMQRWLEQYIRRIELEWWLFAGIFILITFIVFISVFFRVNRAAKDNPAEAIYGIG